MSTLLVVFQIIALLSVSALCIYVIVVLAKGRSILMDLRQDMRKMTEHTIPVLENLEVITTKFRTVAGSIEEQVDLVKDSIRSVKQIADDLVAFERKVQDRVETPVLEAASFIAAVYKGLRTFLDRVKN